MTVEALELPSRGQTMSASVTYAGEPTLGIGDSRLLLVLPGESLVAAFGPSGELIAGRVAGTWRGESSTPAPAARVVHANVPFALRAVLALAFLFGFYALALGLIVTLLAIPYITVVTLHRIHIKLSIGCIGAAFVIARALFFVKPQAFQAPGPTVREADQQELFALIREVATAMNTRMPADVYLVPDVNAFVAEVGGFLGFGTRRVMGIGLGLLAVDDVSNLKATLAHELGHFTGGDTALGGVIYRTRASIGHVLTSLGHGPLAKPFEWYGHVYLRITHAVSRHQELEADRAGIRVAGRAAHIEGLQREVRAGVAFGGFVHGELAPLCDDGVCPKPLYDGFVKFFAQIPDADLDGLIADRPADPLDTHPALAARIAFAETVEDPGVVRDTRPAMALLRGAAEVEIALEPRLAELPQITRGEVAPKVLGRALGVLAGAALVERGGVWKTAVGTPLLVELHGETFSPLVAGSDAISSPSPEVFRVLAAHVPPYVDSSGTHH